MERHLTVIPITLLSDAWFKVSYKVVFFWGVASIYLRKCPYLPPDLDIYILPQILFILTKWSSSTPQPQLYYLLWKSDIIICFTSILSKRFFFLKLIHIDWYQSGSVWRMLHTVQVLSVASMKPPSNSEIRHVTTFQGQFLSNSRNCQHAAQNSIKYNHLPCI